MFASKAVVNAAIPAYHLRDLIKRYAAPFPSARTEQTLLLLTYKSPSCFLFAIIIDSQELAEVLPRGWSFSQPPPVGPSPWLRCRVSPEGDSVWR